MQSIVVKTLAFVAMVAIASLEARTTATDEAKTWAVIVAGSQYYMNYRHQADVCHAYQIAHAHGIPDEQIIVFMYDDIAFDSLNPTPGALINKPGGSDVYRGIVKDYTGYNVTSQNFLNVLLGDEAAMAGIGSGKVLKSGPNDNVFVNFAGNGANGLLAFPNDILYVDDLIKTLKSMNQKNLYNKLVLYVEATESGSMFENVLPDDINIYAETATNDVEYSSACYWDDERGTYLGDLYSVSWMEDTDSEDISTETIEQQFLIAQNLTNLSNVSQYGDLNLTDLTVGQFQGQNTRLKKAPTSFKEASLDAVPAPDVPLHILKNKLDKLGDNHSEKAIQLRKELNQMLQNRAFMDEKVNQIVNKSVSTNEQATYAKTQRLRLKNLSCYRQVTQHFSENCFSLSKNYYALRKVTVLVNLCEMGVNPTTVIEAMDCVCTQPPTYGIH